MDDAPRCLGRHNEALDVCRACYTRDGCSRGVSGPPRESRSVQAAKPVEGEVAVERFHLGHTLGSGQLFRWGRDRDGWWKGIAYGTAFHLKQDENRLRFRASGARVKTYAGEMEVAAFLRWYLRLDTVPSVRAPRADRYLRQARDRLSGFRFARQEPFECTISYVLSVQAHMSLTKRRVHFLARILGQGIDFMGARYWQFPEPEVLADLNSRYFRHRRFGWRSTFVAASARFVAERLDGRDAASVDLAVWRDVVEALWHLAGTGVGLKVQKCIDLFAMERLDAVPVDTWVRKMARNWYGVDGSDAKVCAWAEARGGRWAGYANEYLFAYYRELHAASIQDRVISFCASDLPSDVLPFESVARPVLHKLTGGTSHPSAGSEVEPFARLRGCIEKDGASRR